MTTSRARHGHRGKDRERVSTGHTEQDRSSEHRGDRGTERERSAGGLVTHGHPGIFTDKRKRKEKEEPVDTQKRRGRKTEEGSAWVSCSL